MFTLSKTIFGVTFPLPVIYVNETSIEYEIEDVAIQATISEETLGLFVFTGVLRFVSGVDEFTAPFQGSDFLSEKTGSLFVTITESLPSGLYRAYLINSLALLGVCGGGPSGMIQAGNISQAVSASSIVLQVQSLPDDWKTVSALAAQPYAVSTLTRP